MLASGLELNAVTPLSESQAIRSIHVINNERGMGKPCEAVSYPSLPHKMQYEKEK